MNESKIHFSEGQFWEKELFGETSPDLYLETVLSVRKRYPYMAETLIGKTGWESVKQVVGMMINDETKKGKFYTDTDRERIENKILIKKIREKPEGEKMIFKSIPLQSYLEIDLAKKTQPAKKTEFAELLVKKLKDKINNQNINVNFYTGAGTHLDTNEGIDAFISVTENNQEKWLPIQLKTESYSMREKGIVKFDWGKAESDPQRLCRDNRLFMTLDLDLLNKKFSEDKSEFPLYKDYFNKIIEELSNKTLETMKPIEDFHREKKRLVLERKTGQK